MSGDREQEYFSDGIADDIITELSRSRSLFVIARNSSFTYKGRAVDVKQVARELGVRYVVEGGVRRGGSRIRVTAQLIDAETGNHIWAERYDRALEDVFAVQDEITTAVVKSIVPAVADAELRRVLRKPPENLGAWEAYQRGLWHMGRGTQTHNSQAQQFFRRAIDDDPSFASAHSASAMALWLDSVYGEGIQPETARAVGERARAAVEIDPNDADAQAVLTMVRHYLGGVEQAPAEISALSATLAHNPNASWAHGVKGMILVQSGYPRGGREALLAAERLNPRDPGAAFFPVLVAVSYYYERDYARAVTSAKTAVERYPNDPRAHRLLAAALGQLGAIDEARDALHQALHASHEQFTRFARRRPVWALPENYQHFMEGLRKAGWEG